MTKPTTYEYTVERPLNREPPIEELLSSFIGNHNVYDRNHGPIPHIEPSSHILHVDGCVKEPFELTVEQLRNDYPQHRVLAALQCAGNRRHSMRTLLKEVNGLDWLDQAIMNCTWSGPRLSTILHRAGITENMKDERGGWKGYVAFACYETLCQDDTWYGAGVPLSRVMDEEADVILALDLNDEPLTDAHGAPVRALVPGIAGARSVKWLNRITVQMVDSPNYYQTHDYKILPYEAVDVEAAEEWWGLVPPLMDMPVNSVVGLPKSGSTVCLDGDGKVEARGFAVPGGMDGPVKTVEVSGDGGNTWVEAELDFGEHDVRTDEGKRTAKWSWCLWKTRVAVAMGDGRKIVCRAVDYGGNEQTEHGIWNLRGVGYNAWGLARDLKVIEFAN